MRAINGLLNNFVEDFTTLTYKREVNNSTDPMAMSSASITYEDRTAQGYIANYNFTNFNNDGFTLIDKPEKVLYCFINQDIQLRDIFTSVEHLNEEYLVIKIKTLPDRGDFQKIFLKKCNT